MRNFNLVIFLFAMLVVAAGCGCHKHLPVSTETMRASSRDSSAMKVRDSVVIRYVEVDIPIPAGTSSAILPGRDTSHLETDLARSTAYIDSLGRLYHDIKNKPGQMRTTVPQKEYYHELEHQESVQESRTVTIEVPKLVEKELTWWQKTWITMGKVFAVALMLALGAVVVKLFL